MKNDKDQTPFWDTNYFGMEDLPDLPRGFAPVSEVVKKCTCGVEKLGEGKHSNWCDKERNDGL